MRTEIWKQVLLKETGWGGKKFNLFKFSLKPSQLSGHSKKWEISASYWMCGTVFSGIHNMERGIALVECGRICPRLVKTSTGPHPSLMEA